MTGCCRAIYDALLAAQSLTTVLTPLLQGATGAAGASGS